MRSLLTAYQAGMRTQSITLLLPLLYPTDLDDRPGGVREEFKAALPLVESILKELKKEEGLEGKLIPRILDDGDAVAVWEGDNISCVLLPTAETLKEVIDLEKSGKGQKLFLMINPQWSNKGQLIPDFGLFGRAAKEEFVGKFAETYFLKQIRVEGESIRILRAYPSGFQVFAIDGADTFLLGTFEQQPTYDQIITAAKARPGSKASMTWLERAQSEFVFNQKSLQTPNQPTKKD